MANTLQRRFRKAFRLRKKQVSELGQRADDQLEKNVFRKITHLLSVRRFVAGWLVLVLLLAGCVVAQISALGGYYKTTRPVSGGLYSEGIVGAYSNANPIYATGPVDEGISRLLFAGLFSFDDQNHLAPDLAEGYTVDPSGTKYSVTLRAGLHWHDGKPLTAKDVVFTYRTIQNPDAQSPLNRSWQRVAIDQQDSRTVTFTLPNPLTSFPYSLTNGIVPEHVLGGVSVDGLRSAPFNTVKPVGSGPFKLRALEVQGDSPATREFEVALEPYGDYHRGRPKLNSFVVHAYPDSDTMLAAFRDKSVSAVAGLPRLPGDLAEDRSVKQYDLPVTAANMVFFKNSGAILKDQTVRQALVLGADPAAAASALGYQVKLVHQPFLQGQTAYNRVNDQQTGKSAEAIQKLDAAGWKVSSDGIRQKDGQQLAFKLYAPDTPENQRVVRTLQKQWRTLGADVQIYLQNEVDLRTTVATHSYDALFYGISVGNDPDVFAYWHSSQSDVRSQNRLNFSEYRSTVADEALEAGRTRTDPKLRAVKYQAFLDAWKNDAPALGLYQPRFLYVTRGEVYGLRDHTINAEADRFNNVQDWRIRRAQMPAPQH